MSHFVAIKLHFQNRPHSVMPPPQNKILGTSLDLQHIQSHEYLFHYEDMTHMFFLHFMPQTIFCVLQPWKGATWLKKYWGYLITLKYGGLWSCKSILWCCSISPLSFAVLFHPSQQKWISYLTPFDNFLVYRKSYKKIKPASDIRYYASYSIYIDIYSDFVPFNPALLYL